MSPTTATGSRAERAARRREEIVEIASDLFSRKGFRGTSLADVAGVVGMTQAGLLHHFRSKEGLLTAVVERRNAASEAFARELMERDVPGRVSGMTEFAKRNADHRELAKLFAVLVAENLDADDPAHQHFVDRYRVMRGIIADALARGRDSGELRADLDPRRTAVEIVAMLDGLQTQWLLDPDEVDIVESVTAYAATLTRQLGAP